MAPSIWNVALLHFLKNFALIPLNPDNEGGGVTTPAVVVVDVDDDIAAGADAAAAAVVVVVAVTFLNGFVDFNALFGEDIA